MTFLLGGFGAPVAGWLCGPLRDWAEHLLDESRLRRDGLFDAAAIRAIWTRFQGGERKWHTHLWSVLMFQAWLEQRRIAAALAPLMIAPRHETAPAAQCVIQASGIDAA